MIAGILYAVVGFIELLVGLRFLFLLFGANPATAFVSWIYTWSEPFVAPFYGIFGQNVAINAPGIPVQSILDWASLVAFIVYGLIAAIIAGIARTRRV